MSPKKRKPIIVITGSSGNIGSALTASLSKEYQIVGFDINEDQCDIAVDLTSKLSVNQALDLFKEQYSEKIAAVIHLAAYFDFTGEDSPLYESVNEKGTQYLLAKLQEFKVERFIYTSTMLVHKPGEPGETIDEQTPVEPQWAYPESKFKTEKIIQKHHGKIPYVILRLAGLYDDSSCVPTLANQIARCYERHFKSHFYSGNIKAGQSFIHQDDLIQLFKKTIEKRNQLPDKEIILAGEEEAVSYEKLQQIIMDALHDEEPVIYNIPSPVAKTAAWIEEKTEPVIPDDFDQGKKPFIRPFMIDMASDHYALNISKAREALDWKPKHSIKETLPKIIKSLKKNPKAWYKKNGILYPDWMAAVEKDNPEKIRSEYESNFRKKHQETLWAHFINISLGFWLISSPATLGYQSQSMIYSDIISGILLICFASLALSWRLAPVRWLSAAVGLWLIFAPLVFWTPSAAAYLNDTLIGSLVMGFSILIRPAVGVAPNAAMRGSPIPLGWSFSPSSWSQRLPIIILAFIGLFISRYMAAYQLEHIDGVWEPFFMGSTQDPKNGTEEIITSYLSEAWPVPDAGLGAVVYVLEILTGMIGGPSRWRTMPWLVLLFGIMIIPLGVVSITFIIIQPILLNTWCTLCLITAVAMLLQVPYSFDEIVATCVFLWRRWKAGRPVLKILFTGDNDEENKSKEGEVLDDFEQSPFKTIHMMLGQGITVPWNLGLTLLIGVWLMLTRLTLNTTGSMANADHLIGALIITVTMAALAEVARPLRLINLVFAVALLIIPFIYETNILSMISSLIFGVLLFILTIPRGKVTETYGQWNKFIF